MLFRSPKAKRAWYVRLDNAKANIAPPAECAQWFEKINVTINEGNDQQDNVGALKVTNFDFVKQVSEARALLDATTPAKLAENDAHNMEQGHDKLFHILPKIMKLNDKWTIGEITKQLNNTRTNSGKYSYLEIVTKGCLTPKAVTCKIRRILTNTFTSIVEDEYGSWPVYESTLKRDKYTFRLKNMDTGQGSPMQLWLYDISEITNEVIADDSGMLC